MKMKIQKIQLLGIGLLIITGLLAWYPYRPGNGGSLGQAFFSPFISIFFLSLWLAISGHNKRHRKLIGISLLTGLIIGIISFLAGFVVPLLLTPEANQGPLLGIFFTGPIGFAAGVLLGIPVSFIYLKWKEGKETKTHLK
jgi:hypothetical protein